MQVIRAFIVITAACLSLLVATPVIANPSGTAPKIHSEVHWTYQDATGPDYWANLAPKFATCKSGKSQSPINLSATESADMINPDFHYENVPLNVLNNGHTVQVPYAPGSYVTLEGQRYNLLQFHLHSPSEHVMNDQPWDAELHLVHQNDQGDLAVVAVLLQEDDAANSSDDFDRLSKNLPAKAGDKVRTGKTINAQNLLPSKTTTYRYSGSLTTPPCSESVTWLVMTEPVSLPAEQIAQYEKLLDHNNRPLQQLNSRSVEMDISP